MRNYKKLILAAGVLALSLTAAGCSSDSQSMSSAPRVPYTTLKSEVVEADTTGAEIELLNLEKPIDYCYSSTDTDMIFKMKDGTWLDALDVEIPLNQEKFQAMADNFLTLRAVSKVDEPGTLDEYGLGYPAYTLYITDGAKGEVNISIGAQDSEGNYYATLDESNIYTIKKETVESMVFDYDTLVICDSLDITVTAADIKSASVTEGGKTKKVKTSDTEAMTRIAEGLSELKPSDFSSFHAVSQELNAAELSESQRITFQAEINNGGEVQSITVYIGTFANPTEELRYVQLDGSQMIAMVDSKIVADLLNLAEEEQTES